MHDVRIRQEIIDRVVARRGRLHWFDTLDPARARYIDSLQLWRARLGLGSYAF